MSRTAISSPTSPLNFTDRIPIEELELSNETLGSGSFGTVFKGRWRGRNVAVKQFKTREEIDSFLVEVKQLSCVKHPNIVTLYGASTSAESAFLIMEYAEGGSLNHLIHECRQQQYDLRHACSWAMQTARGVAYLHGIRPKPIMHRDLKPANLLLFCRGKILKICDFGTACTVKTQMTNNTGSASYMAPEVFSTSSYLESGDVFSWSIIFWEILARRHPYSPQYSNPFQILWRVKQEGIRPSELEGCPPRIWNFITKCWNQDPSERPTMRMVADEMEFIFSLTEKSANDRNFQHKISPSQHILPICSHFVEQGLEQVRPINFQSNRVSATKTKRELSTHHKALLRRLESLRERAKELELARCNKISPLDSIQEVEELKKKTDLKNEELKRLRSLLKV